MMRPVTTVQRFPALTRSIAIMDFGPLQTQLQFIFLRQTDIHVSNTEGARKKTPSAGSRESRSLIFLKNRKVHEN